MVDFDLQTAVPEDSVEEFDLTTARPYVENNLLNEFETLNYYEKLAVSVFEPEPAGKLESAVEGLKSAGKRFVLGVTGIASRLGGSEQKFIHALAQDWLDDAVDEKAMAENPVSAGVGEMVGGISTFVAMAPLFPQSLLGLTGLFGTMGAIEETGKQVVEGEEDVARVVGETAKGMAFAPVWRFASSLNYIGYPLKSALTRAIVRGGGSAVIDIATDDIFGAKDVFGDNLGEALVNGGVITAVSLLFELPYLGKTALGRRIAKEFVNKTKAQANAQGVKLDIPTIDAGKLDQASQRKGLVELLKISTKLNKIKPDAGIMELGAGKTAQGPRATKLRLQNEKANESVNKLSFIAEETKKMQAEELRLKADAEANKVEELKKEAEKVAIERANEQEKQKEIALRKQTADREQRVRKRMIAEKDKEIAERVKFEENLRKEIEGEYVEDVAVPAEKVDPDVELMEKARRMPLDEFIKSGSVVDGSYVEYSVSNDMSFDEEGNEIIGDDYVLIDKVFVPKDKRGRGYGKSIIKNTLREIINNPETKGMPIKLDADPFDNGMEQEQLVEFYENLGFSSNPVDGMSGVVMDYDGGISEPGEFFTKQQLTDLWNKANQQDPDAELMEEAKKYKSAWDFTVNNVGKGENEVIYYKLGDKDIEIIKNPTSRDVQQIDKEFREEFPQGRGEPSVRTTYDARGNKYIFRSDKALHSDIEPFLMDKYGVEVSQQYGTAEKYFTALWNKAQEQKVPAKEKVITWDDLEESGIQDFKEDYGKLSPEQDLALAEANKDSLKEIMDSVNNIVGTIKGRVAKGVSGISDEESIMPKSLFAKEGEGVPLDNLATELEGDMLLLGYEPDGEGLKNFIYDYIGTQEGRKLSKGKIVKLKEDLSEARQTERTAKGRVKAKESFIQQRMRERLKEMNREKALKDKLLADKIKGVEKALSKPAGKKTKTVIREKTGIQKDNTKEISEREALKVALKRERRAAGLAVKRYKNVQRLLKGLVAKTPEQISFKARAKINQLKEKAKTVRRIEDLEKIYADIMAVKEIGRAQYKKFYALRKMKNKIRTDLLTQLVSMVGPPEKGAVTKAYLEGLDKPGRGMYLMTMTPHRWMDILDGRKGTFNGLHNKIFYDRANEAVSLEEKKTTERIEGFVKFLESNDYKAKNFFDLFKVTDKGVEKINGYSGDSNVFSKQEMIGVYNSLKDPQRLKAMIFGNRVSLVMADKIVKALSPIEKRIGDYITDDYERNFDRLNNEFINYTDGKHELDKVAGKYSPISRIMNEGMPLEEELSMELGQRKELKKTYVNRSMTKARQEISEASQKPIRLDDINLFMQTVRKQEHFISHGNMIKDFHNIINNKKYSQAIIDNPNLGVAYLKTLQQWANSVSNPNHYKKYDKAHNLIRDMRGALSTAYLGYNLVTMGKQSPSLFLFLGELTPDELRSATNEFISNRDEVIEFIHSKSPQMKNRRIEQELENLKYSNPNRYNRVIKQFGQTGFKGIYLVDQFVTHSGWLGVYSKAIKTMSERDAINWADKVVLMTQPSASAKDLASIYTTNEFLNAFMQFTNQLNKIWNIQSYDAPTRFANKEYGKAMLTVLGLGLSGFLIWMISNGRAPKDEEELRQSLTDQTISSVPILGPAFMATREGFDMDVPAMASIKVGAKVANDSIKLLFKDHENRYQSKQATKRTVLNIIKLVALVKGIPYSQAFKTISGAYDLSTGKTEDLRRLIWNKYQLGESK